MAKMAIISHQRGVKIMAAAAWHNQSMAAKKINGVWRKWRRTA